jgi:hypothetical protein
MRYLLLAVVAGSGAVLAARAFGGVHSPMNVEGVLALAFIALLLLRDVPNNRQTPAGWRPRFAAILSVIVFFAFALFLSFPLLADDYSHIWNAHHADGSALLAHFIVPEADHFFRPAVYLAYAFDALWAGYTPAGWRISNLILHLVNCLLVFRLCLDLKFSAVAAFGGAVLFGVHGSRPEAVTWIAARFDLLAVLFGLACIIAALRGLWLSPVFLLAAVMSKESAYVLPFVIAAMLVYQEHTWRQIRSAVWPLLALEAVTFAYRTWLLKGIGGYHDATGKPTIFNFGLASTLKALFMRFWAAMFFPVNWTGGLHPVVSVSLCLAIAALAYLAWHGAERRKVMLGLAVATICSLPVQQFLSIGPDLEKSRVLYMASIGLAIIFAALCEGSDVKARACVCAIALFQFVALESNLMWWKRTGYVAEQACLAGAEALRADPRRLAATGLPNVLDGVYFLHTGYPECVSFQLPEASGRVFTTPKPDSQEYSWNEARKILERR